ncbi:MAG: hypothetical protein V3W18_11635 [candidate division Zixibacteria bacterium]
MSRLIKRVVIALAIIMMVGASFIAVKTNAVPSFARENGIECSTCHTQWPQLNDYGREFKESGFNFSGATTKIADGVDLDKSFPGSGALNLRFLDKRFSRDRDYEDLTQGDKQLKLRAGHELELFFAGRASEKISFFAEVEAEDEWPDPNGDAPGFQLQLATAVAEYRCNYGVTFTGGIGNVFYADAYNTLNYSKMARKAWIVTGNVPHEAQFLSVSARPTAIPKLFVLAALSGNDGDLEGHDARDLSFRAAYDFLPWLMFGGYANLGKTYNPATWRCEDQIDRGGLDFQVDRGSLHINGVWSRRHDYTMNVGQDVDGTWETVAGLEFMYITYDANGHPIWAPNLILDYYAMDIMATGGGTGFTPPLDRTGYGIFLTRFLKENAKAQIGVEGTLAAAAVYNLEHKEMRVTLVGVFGF